MTLSEHIPRTKHWQRQTQYKRLHRKGPTQTIPDCDNMQSTRQNVGNTMAALGDGNVTLVTILTTTVLKIPTSRKKCMKRPANQENENKVISEML